MGKIAIIRVRGPVDSSKEIRDTLDLLRLYRKNFCVVVEDTPSYKGMINKVKDYVTFGEIDDPTYKEIIEKRSEEYRGKEKDAKGKINYKKYIEVNGKKIKPFFRLSPPRGGFGRKGIKISFTAKGALGNRKEKINDLLKRMI